MPVPGKDADSYGSTRYDCKPSPWSSHSLLLKCLQVDGHGKRILDVGCAGGYIAEILATRGYDVVGIDKSGALSETFPKSAALIQADLDSGVPHLPGMFNFILCADVLEHLRDPLKLLRELRPRVAAGGRLVASLPNSGNLYFRLNVLVGRFPKHDRGLFDRTHLHFHMWSGWVDLLKRGGFVIERVLPTGVPVGLAVPRWNQSLVVHLLELLAYCLARAWKELFAYQFVVVARPQVSS